LKSNKTNTQTISTHILKSTVRSAERSSKAEF
jgi:hypothetical protein